MNFQGKRILVLEGYARQCLPYIRVFKKRGCVVTILCNSIFDIGYASRFPDRKILGICDPDNYEESEQYICNLIKSGAFDLVVPMVDFSARILSTHKEELSHYSKIASNDCDVFLKAQDKLSVMRTCIEHSLPCPKTLIEVKNPDSILKSNLVYPIVVKPRNDCGAKGFHCFQNEIELISFISEKDPTEYIVQEYIPQRDQNLSANLFIDNEGKVKSAFVYRSKRWYPLKGGTGTFNQMVERPDIIKYCTRLTEILNLRGYIGVDLIDDPRDCIPKIIEVNPRIMACVKIGFDAGIDLGTQLLEKEFDGIVTEYHNYKTNINVRMSQTDILWFLKSSNRFHTEPSWFSIRNTKDQTFAWDDPLPWFAFLLRGLTRYKSEMKKRK
jgi:predicted ATP-grasp superfamily ATP-dependent carboligase